MGISNEGQEQSDKFQFIEQFPAVILRNEETKNLDLDSGEKGKERDSSLRKQGHLAFCSVMTGGR